jgi:hypothetical protein
MQQLLRQLQDDMFKVDKWSLKPDAWQNQKQWTP